MKISNVLKITLVVLFGLSMKIQSEGCVISDATEKEAVEANENVINAFDLAIDSKLKEEFKEDAVDLDEAKPEILEAKDIKSEDILANLYTLNAKANGDESESKVTEDSIDPIAEPKIETLDLDIEDSELE